MRYSLVNIQNYIESTSVYRFDLVMVMKQVVLKLCHLPEGYEIFVELNKGTKTILPYVSVVSVDVKNNLIDRSNELFDLDKIKILLDWKLIYLKIDYKVIEKPIIYKQEKLNI